MRVFVNPITPSLIRRATKATCSTSIVLIFTTMSVVAFDGSTQGECYDYVVTGCNEEPNCTKEELGFLLDSCDVYPKSTNTSRPKFTAKQPPKKVIKSLAYKAKIKKLKTDIRRK